MIIKGLWN